MSMNEGVLGTWSFGGDHAHTQDHPPVLLSGAVAVNSGVYPAGLVLMRDEDGDLAPWDGIGDPEDEVNGIAGVCDMRCNTADQVSCVYLAHGTVRAAVLTKAGGAALTAAEKDLLVQATIYPI